MPAWPTGIIEYGSFSWLRREVSQLVGLPTDSRLLDHFDRNRVDSIIESGLHRFYYPNPGMFNIADATDAQKERLRRAPHQWTFLQHNTTIEVEIGKTEYDLPPDFSNFLDEPTTSRSGGRIAIASAGHIRQLLASSPQTGAPKYVAWEPKSHDASSSQRYSMFLYPIPDGAETIVVRHGISPVTLSSSRQHPYGGVEHAETILACCALVAAERAGADTTAMQAQVAERMAASVLFDVHAAQPSSEGVWPVDEADNGLSVDRAYLSRIVGREFGYGPNRHTWTHQQGKLVEEAIKTGLRRFYSPAVLPGERYPHEWSFLKPLAQLTTVAGESAVMLPEGFSMLDGNMTYADGESILSTTVRHVSEEMIRDRQQRRHSLTGRPEMVAIRVVSSDVPESRYEAVFWPTPDDAYVLDYRYRMHPVMIAMQDGSGAVPGISSDGASQPEGGQAHAQTIIESCLLACDELLRRDTRHRAESFQQHLAASVGFDRKLNSPKTIGYSGDRGVARRVNYRDYSDHVVTYNGQTY